MIILVRHAESTANANNTKELDPLLSYDGIQSCVKLKDTLEEYKNFEVWTSSLIRSKTSFKYRL